MKQYEDAMKIYTIGHKYYKDKNNCSVVAVAVSTGVAYGAAFKALEKAGRVRKRGATTGQIRKALDYLGYTTRTVEKDFKTVRTVTDRLPSTGNFLAYTPSHVLSIRNGRVMDWTEGRRQRIYSVTEVIKK
tara:strand:+ start:282 stop:674 length:393 start_codon:yes stop_codon:yes gene_type:complete